MKKNNLLPIIFMLLCISNIQITKAKSFPENILKETCTYAVKDADTLRLDRWYNTPTINAEKQPCLVFVFGGGFAGGQRYDESYNEYFSLFLEKGYTVVSIDYRLGMKNSHQLKDPMKFPALLSNSIYMAVEDLFDATAFILKNSTAWHVDPDMIVISGSSAGAITVLHAANTISNRSKLPVSLPDDFQYAGVLSFAGAIFSDSGAIKWDTPPSPMLLFHGDADANVPFDKLEALGFGAYGSQHIANQLTEMNSPHWFYKVENAAHEIAGTPMTENLHEISSFLDNYIHNKQLLITNTSIYQIGKSEMKKDFNLMDYIKTNYGGN